MAFGKKNEGNGGDAVPQERAQAAPKTKKRKPADMLSSVLSESAPQAAIDLLKRNEPFVLAPVGDKAWVALLLSAEAIGGLSTRHKSDEAKGSLIELIRSDQVQAVVTAEMLQEEVFSIVPTIGTLDRMGEYSMLTGAPYVWALLTARDGGSRIEADPIREGTYAEAVEIAHGRTDLQTAFPLLWDWALSTASGGFSERPPSDSGPQPVVEQAAAPVAALAAPAAPAAATAPAAVSVADGDDPLGAAEAGPDEGIDYAALAEAEDEGAESFSEADFSGSDPDLDGGFEAIDEDSDEGWGADVAAPAAAFDEVQSDAQPAQSDGYAQYVEEMRDREVTEAEVRDTIARRFLGDDLDLELDLQEFEKTFGTAAPAVSLDVSENSSDWLGSQVALLSHQANAELRQLHADNTNHLRTLYVDSMGFHVSAIFDEVSVERSGTIYSGLMGAASSDFEAAKKEAPQELVAVRTRLTELFDQAAEDRAVQAAAHARSQYKDKNRPKLERDLAEAGLDLDRRNEEKFAHQRQTILDMRRRDARKRLELGTTKAFSLLLERQEVMQAAERELLREWNGRLMAFIDENRKIDVSRAEALAEQLVREDQVEALRQQHAAELERLSGEQENTVRRLHLDISRMHEENLQALAAREAEWGSLLQVERERTSNADRVSDSLREQMEKLNGTLKKQYAHRIEELEGDKLSYSLELERADKLQRRSSRVIMLVVVLIALAAVLVGFIIGVAFNLAGAQDAQTGMVLFTSASALLDGLGGGTGGVGSS